MEIKQRVGRKMLLPNVKNSFEKTKQNLKCQNLKDLKDLHSDIEALGTVKC